MNILKEFKYWALGQYQDECKIRQAVEEIEDRQKSKEKTEPHEPYLLDGGYNPNWKETGRAEYRYNVDKHPVKVYDVSDLIEVLGTSSVNFFGSNFFAVGFVLFALISFVVFVLVTL